MSCPVSSRRVAKLCQKYEMSPALKYVYFVTLVLKLCEMSSDEDGGDIHIHHKDEHIGL
jgi:hypothetical protein